MTVPSIFPSARTRHLVLSRRAACAVALLLFLTAACAPTPDDALQSGEESVDSGTAGTTETAEAISLFDGESLEGWERHMGLPEDQVGGKWEVIDGAIEGDQDPPGHGGFLVTTEEFGDFELELETQLDYPVDSGIFLRVGEDGKSHQVTLDYREGGSIGSIYLPWTQAGVYTNPDGMEKFQEDAWNDVRVRIEGEPSRIRFWLNGELVTDFQHTAETTQGVPRQGTIGLQVHPGESYEAGKKVRFRNIQIWPLG
jgi:hypothetical protein